MRPSLNQNVARHTMRLILKSIVGALVGVVTFNKTCRIAETLPLAVLFLGGSQLSAIRLQKPGHRQACEYATLACHCFLQNCLGHWICAFRACLGELRHLIC